MSHAKFGSPSMLYRLRECPGSLAYTKDLPEPLPSPFAEEGTCFHELMEYTMGVYRDYGEETYKIIESMIPDSHTGYPGMYDEVVGALKEMAPKWDKFKSKHSDAVMHLELKVKLTEDIYGTSDIVFVGTNNVTGLTDIVVLDWKYGMGVRVEAQGSLQGLAYLLASIKTLGLLNIGVAMFVIAQVRLDDGWSTATYTADELETHREEIVRIVDRVKAVYRGEYSVEANLHPGNHCRFCKANGICVAQKKETYDVIEATASELDIEEVVNHLTLDQQVAIFLKKSQIEDFLDAVAKSVSKSLEAGIKHPSVKLIQTAGRRRWKATTTEEDLVKLGVKNPTVAALKGITEVEKQIGKGMIDDLTEKSSGKREVVHINDPRPEVLISNEPAELDMQ